MMGRFKIYDIVLTGNSVSAIDQLIACLDKEFALKNLGSLNCFLGIEVLQTSNGLYYPNVLSQCRYIDIIQRAGMTESKPLKTPSSDATTSTQIADAPFSDPTLYSQLVGAL